jgi:hypothetical protein
MRRNFAGIHVVVLAAFALFAFVYPDDLSEDDSASSQSEMLKESLVKVTTHRDQHGVVVDSTRLFASNNSTYSPSASGRATSSMLLSLAVCVLRC